MIYTSEKKESAIIFIGYVANELIKMGYKIIEIKTDKHNKNKSVFVFKCEGNFENDVYALTETDNVFLKN